MTAKHRQRVQKSILSEPSIGSAHLIKSRSVGEFLGRQVVPSRIYMHGCEHPRQPFRCQWRQHRSGDHNVTVQLGCAQRMTHERDIYLLGWCPGRLNTFNMNARRVRRHTCGCATVAVRGPPRPISASESPLVHGGSMRDFESMKQGKPGLDASVSFEFQDIRRQETQPGKY